MLRDLYATAATDRGRGRDISQRVEGVACAGGGANDQDHAIDQHGDPQSFPQAPPAGYAFGQCVQCAHVDGRDDQ